MIRSHAPHLGEDGGRRDVRDILAEGGVANTVASRPISPLSIPEDVVVAEELQSGRFEPGPREGDSSYGEDPEKGRGGKVTA